MKYLKRFNENVSFYDYLEPGKLWTSIGASSYEKMEYWGNQENITSSEDKILDELVNKHIVFVHKSYRCHIIIVYSFKDMFKLVMRAFFTSYKIT